jgi:hypothetical protein
MARCAADVALRASAIEHDELGKLLNLASAAVALHSAQALIAGGAHLNAANRRGARPLHYAWILALPMQVVRDKNG